MLEECIIKKDFELISRKSLSAVAEDFYAQKADSGSNTGVK